jgi:hypothetical protein
MRKLLLGFFLLFFMNPLFAQDASESFEPSGITADVAAKYAVYAMISSNVYHKTDRVKFPVERENKGRIYYYNSYIKMMTWQEYL